MTAPSQTRSRTSARLLWLLTLGLMTAQAGTTHSAVDPAPRPDQGWQDRHKSINQKAADTGEKAQVIFIGDSITQGWEGAGKEVWARYYELRNAVNLGIGGDRTQHVLWRLDNGNLTGLKPKAAVVMIGTNNSNGEDNTVEQIADGVTAIVRKLREKLPEMKVLLLAIFPRGENPIPQRGKILQVNQILQKLADGHHVLWMDFGHEYLTAAGLIPRDLMPDYLHLSPKAYGLWAEAIEDRLSKVVGDERVRPAAGEAGAELTGDWVWTIRGPDGNPVEAAMILKQEGDSVTGRFARGPDRWIEIENGKVNGNGFTWTVKRDRPGGDTMTYDMSGKLDGDRIAGKARTTMDGNEVVADWSARRK